MTLVITQPRLASQAESQEGPVLLASKPLHAKGAPLLVARWLASREDRELNIVTVIQQGDALAVAAGMQPLPPEYYVAERRELAERMRVLLDCGDAFVPSSDVEVLEGPTARAVVDAARARGARVIVIGTGGHDAIGRHVFGEQALQILSLADRPVLVVPADAVPGPVMTAVVAVDFSASSLRAARAVVPMLSDGSRLHLVHVRTSHSRSVEMAGWPEPEYDRRCAELFRQFQRQLPLLPGVTVTTHVLRGEPAAAVVGYAAAWKAGLIACGRAERTFVERLFVRSLSTDVVRRAACPVLVVPEAAGDRTPM